MKFKAFFIMIFILRAALFGAAQEAIVVYEGATTNNFVEKHPGSSYAWVVNISFIPDVNAPPDDYEIIGPADSDKIQIKWLHPGIYYLKVTETDLKGCENLKALPVRVISNDRSIGFMTTASSSCSNSNGNRFEIPVAVTDNNGNPLTSEYFPLVVEFKLNNIGYSQLLSFENQIIIIDDNWLVIDNSVNTEINVEITKTVDVFGNLIQPAENYHVHQRTIFARPEIEFVDVPSDIYQGTTVDYQVKLISGEPVSAKYTWDVIPANGTSTDLNLLDTNSAGILWDGPPGSYTIQVLVTDGNNCFTEIISKPFTVIEMVNNLPQLFAVPDFFSGYTGETIAGDLSANDFTASDDDYKLIYTLVGESIEGLILQPDGTFIYNAPSGFTGKISFTVSVCYEDNLSICETAEVVIKVVYLNTASNTVPVAVTDKHFVLPGNIFVGNVLENDFDPDGDESILSVATTTLVGPENGSVKLNEFGGFVYTPNSGFFGRDKFQYRICDNGTPTLCDSAWVYVFVNTYTEDKRQPSVYDPAYAQIAGILAGKDTTIGNCNPYKLIGYLDGTEGFKFIWEPSERLDNPTLPTPVFTPGTTTTFKLTVTDSYGFSMSDNVVITVADIIANAGDDVFMEKNSTTILDGTGSIGEELQFSWTTIDGKIDSGANTANPVVSGFGNYYLQVTDVFGCVSTDSVNLSRMAFAPVANDDYDTTKYQTEVIIPVLYNDIDEENSIVPSTLSISKSPVNGTAYVDFDDYTVHYRPNEGFSGSDNFEYRICNTYNLCDQANVYVLVTDFKFLVPNAFSPNGDGINDYFEIVGIEYYEGNSITIINRWGNKVYEAKNYGISTTPKFWDGKANTGIRIGNDELPTGTYYYILDLGNGEKPIGGSIYLDR